MSDSADSSSPSPSDQQHDVFGPPPEAIEVHCLHCDHSYMSDLIIAIQAADGSIHYACPVPNCDGMGFGFDIHPTDPTWCSEEMGYFQSWDDDEEEGDFLDDDGNDGSNPFAIDQSNEDDDGTGEWIAEEVSESAGQFDPPKDWTPDIDREDGDTGEFDLFAPENGDDAPFDDPDSQYVRPAPRHFTREDYDKAKADGVYDRLAESIREWWNACERSRKEGHARRPSDDPSFSDDDIPF